MARSKKAILGPRQAMGINIEGDIQASLEKFEKKIKEQVLRSGARAGALVFYNEMRAKVPVDSGTLYGAIYHWHDDKKSGPDRQVYAIGPNKSKAPHWHHVEYGHWRYNRQSPTGQWLRSKAKGAQSVPWPNQQPPENHPLPGRLETPVWTPAYPYIRPTWQRVGDAMKAAMNRMRERMTEVGSDD